MKVFRHEFLKKYPIVIVREFCDWADGNITSETYYQKVRFNGKPLTFIVFEYSGAKKEHSVIDRSVIGATVAMIGGNEHWSNKNPKLAIKWALNKAMEHNDVGSFNILKSAYEKKYGTCPYEMDENSSSDYKTPYQTDKPDAQVGDEDEFEKLIQMMDEELPTDESPFDIDECEENE